MNAVLQVKPCRQGFGSIQLAALARQHQAQAGRQLGKALNGKYLAF